MLCEWVPSNEHNVLEQTGIIVYTENDGLKLMNIRVSRFYSLIKIGESVVPASNYAIVAMELHYSYNIIHSLLIMRHCH